VSLLRNSVLEPRSSSVLEVRSVQCVICFPEFLRQGGCGSRTVTSTFCRLAGIHLTATTPGKLRATGNGACPRGPNRIRNAPKRYRPIDIDRPPWDVLCDLIGPRGVRLDSTVRNRMPAGGQSWSPVSPVRVLKTPSGFCPRSGSDMFKFPGSATTPSESGGVAWLSWPAGHLQPDEIAGNK
jgi:hypothetical protein